MIEEKIRLKTYIREIYADLITPVTVYLQLRDRFPKSVLLESSEYSVKEGAYSFIACNPIASINLSRGEKCIEINGHSDIESFELSKLTNELKSFSERFDFQKNDLPFPTSGLFGYLGFDAVQGFDTVSFEDKFESDQIPIASYSVYRYMVVFDHFRNKLFLIDHVEEGQRDELNRLEELVNTPRLPKYSFKTVGDKSCNISDDSFVNQVNLAKENCRLGDVFQVVLSRRFYQSYNGDDFNVYRSLRMINPSPYLFYFDFGGFRLFGSSPEAQLIIKNNIAEIHPIAGTFKRTGEDCSDRETAGRLIGDAKENSEHVMLVDLARNDLSRQCNKVKVVKFKEVQYFSHVIHLVSRVEGQIKKGVSSWEVVGSTFPAGTLSGAPKIEALKIIDKLENTARGFYGGCIGIMDFQGNFNAAIMIRSFLSVNNMLISQAGAGVVVDSDPQKELAEVNNKLGALNKALTLAEQL